MRVQTIQQKDLHQYIDSEAYKRAGKVAISKHRALSHIRNPRVRPDDVILVLVYEAEEMVAYLGVFADDLYFTTGVEHAGWLSCMWVNPKMRGKGIAKLLIQTVFEAWDYKILVTEFTPAAYGLYQRTGQFLDLAKPKGMRGYLRLNLRYLLPKKDPKWNKWRPVLSCIDGLFALPNTLRLAWQQIQPPKFEYLAELDDESWNFIAAYKSKELLQRNREDLNWMLRNPWMLSSALTDHTAERYHFSSGSRSFAFLPTKIYDKQFKLIGFLIMSVRDQHLKIPYAYCKEGAEQEVLKVVYHHLLQLKLDMLTLFHPNLLAAMSASKHPFFKLRAFQRHYIIGKVMGEALAQTPDFVLQDGDADAAFT